MVIYFTTSLSEAVIENRWAAEFHRPGYKFTPKNPDAWQKIERITQFCQYGLSIKMNEVGQGVPIYRLNEIEGCFINEAPTKFAPIGERVASEFTLVDGDILFCRTNGNINYVGRTGIYYSGKRSVFASYLVRVRTNSRELLPEFLTIYLNTGFGRKQILRRAMPSNQVNVSAAELKKIDVFLPHCKIQNKIVELVQSAFTERKMGLQSYNKARQLLESELGFNKLKYDKPVGYTARLSEAFDSGRMDAEHFQPKYLAVRMAIIKYANGYQPLLNVADSLQPNIDPRKSPHQYFQYIELANINTSLNVVDGSKRGLGSKLPSRAKRTVQSGDVIASAVVGSVDKVALIGQQQDGFVASTGFFHFRPKSITSEYLLILLRSEAVRMQFQREATGGILSAVPDSRLKHVLVPRVERDIQEKIASLVSDAHEAKRKSKELIHQAKTRVEQLIQEAVQT
ncbi:hypothetical protein ACFL4U_01505 [Candidatus Neomarinimicrobiota bacterium]